MTIELGPYGVWQPAALTTPDMARKIEQLGYTTLWVAGPPVDLAGVDELLEATSTLVLGTSILNIWRGDPAAAAAAYHRVTERFPGRFWLGIGAGHPEQTREFRKPLAAMKQYLDGLDAGGVPVEGRAIAALGPKMLDLTAERAGGAVPYLVPPAHTKLAREALGPAAVLAPEMKVVLDANPARARDTARPRIKHPYLGLVNYTTNLRRLGFTYDDLAGDGSDRLIDAVVAHGDAPTVGARLAEHHAAGADHVAIQVITTRHAAHPTLADVELQVYDDEVFAAYETLAAELF
ncbi:TIGR03620 family F420-dependent LLM class oxidoreductase [Amycolatopsis sp. NPDC051903]|uniref:TIGR03620 family F420-dependent LLM class oxidoreductase n=1 Tax=Amycolatopsis sp. NPDC051903 TaxID=3363936 RepID=UPI003794713F